MSGALAGQVVLLFSRHGLINLIELIRIKVFIFFIKNAINRIVSYIVELDNTFVIFMIHKLTQDIVLKI